VAGRCGDEKGKTSFQQVKGCFYQVRRIGPAFTFCVVNYFGSWYIKDARREIKRCGDYLNVYRIMKFVSKSL
jgi:hypothetical protein